MQFFFKYCFIFDFIDEGNIGLVIDVLMKELGEDFIIVCLVFLENGCIIYCGYLFVVDVLLNELGMENYLLILMIDVNLVCVLQCQIEFKVGLVCYDIVVCGVVVMQECFIVLCGEGVKMVIVDVVFDKDLFMLGEVCVELKFIIGGFGVVLGLFENFCCVGLLIVVGEVV